MKEPEIIQKLVAWLKQIGCDACPAVGFRRNCMKHGILVELALAEEAK